MLANGSVYIDSPDGLKEFGDLICPINDGVMQASDIIGTLSDPAAGALAYKDLTA